MSLFDGAGDIWSTGAFSFESPMKDLLDGGEYTLEQLLREDELLQEVKSMQPQLIDFLAQSSSMATLIEYLVTPFEAGSASDSGDDGIEYESVVPDGEGSGADADAINPADEDIGTESLSEALSREADSETLRIVESEGEARLEGPCDIPSSSTEAPTKQQKIPDEQSPAETIQGDDRDSNEQQTSAAGIEAKTDEPTAAAEDEDRAVDTVVANDDQRKGSEANNSCDPTSASSDDAALGPSPSLETESNSPGYGESFRSSMEQQHSEDDDDEDEKTLRSIRYPYMACEIVCCENSRIVDLLVDGKDDQGASFLDRLFSVLDFSAEQIDDRLAGYFEKVLTVLFRMRSSTLSEYMNNMGNELLPKFMNHLGRYSIMQVLQKLLLPERTAVVDDEFQEDTDGQEIAPPSEDFLEGLFRCSWGTKVETVSLLVSKLIESGSADVEVASHASELLVALVQQAPLDSPMLKMLSSSPILDSIVEKATVLPPEEEFVPHESPMTSAMNLLEAIVLQLGGFGCVPPVNESLSISFNTNAGGAILKEMNGTKEAIFVPEIEEEENATSGEQVSIEQDINPCTTSDDAPCNTSPAEVGSSEEPAADSSMNRWKNLANSDDLKTLLPRALPALIILLESDVTKQWKVMNQVGELSLQLGASRLRIIRLLEALVLLAHPGVDEELISSNALGNCLDLFFAFEWCNMLHQSVANLLVHVLESGSRRKSLQEYLVNDLCLLDRLLDGYDNNEKACGSAEGQIIFRLGYMGHLIIICQAIVHACEPEQNPSTVSTEAVVSSSSAATSISEDNSDRFIPAEAKADVDQETANAAVKDGDSIPAATKSGSTLSAIISDNSASKRWDDFVATSLATVTAVQSTPLGGISPPARDSQDSPLASHSTEGAEMLEMNDNDLDIAVSMMEALNLPRRAGDAGPEHDDDDLNGGIELDRKDIMNGDHSVTAQKWDAQKSVGSSHSEYFYDDPLGTDVLTRKLGIHDLDGEKAVVSDDDEVNGEGYDDEGGGSEHDVPVMDLFTGNFNIDSIDADGSTAHSSAVTVDTDGKGSSPDQEDAQGASADTSWSNFAVFDSSEITDNVESEGQAFGASGTAEDFSFDANFADFSFSDSNNIEEFSFSEVDNTKNGPISSNVGDKDSTEAPTIVAQGADEKENDSNDPFGDTSTKHSIDDLF